MTIIVKNFWHVLFSSPRQQILRCRFGWRLTVPSHSELWGNALWEWQEAAIWHKAKNLLLRWHLTVFLTTAADSFLAHEWYLTAFLTPAMRARPLEWFVPVPAYFLNKQTKNDLHRQAISLKGQIIKSNLGRWEPIRYYFVTRDNLILSAWRASSDLVTGAPWI